ncbi:MAG: nucleoside monophosphate kinase [Candidatus Babeliaceae bacterium]|nr:nucleoside monophosphate kinase [Candidatus Babeliaceae bacterium]
MNNKLLFGVLIFCLVALVVLIIYRGVKPRVTEKKSVAAERKIYVFFGPNACGKGTTAARCASEGFVTISTGDLLRKNVEEKTELGRHAKEYMGKGLLVPDEIVINMVADWLSRQTGSNAPIIFDGFPRTHAQAVRLLDMLDKGVVGPYKINVVRFKISPDELVKRALFRVICSNKLCQHVYSTKDDRPRTPGMCDLCGSQLVRRPDDTEEIVRKRYQDYLTNEGPVLQFFSERSVPVHEVSAEQPIDKVHEAFKEIDKKA